MPDALCAANVHDCEKEATMSKQENKKITILYERLSVEDDREAESNSILYQRELLEDYAERNGFKPYVHISDDGFTGTRWQRQGWQELMSRLEAGDVANVLVKDSTRIGRDYLRVGLFRELLFEKNVRLICVNDGYDSIHGEDEFAGFRDIIAEMYARDTSKKIKSSFNTKAHKGIPLSGKPPYGYKKDPADITKWIVDEYAANIVRRMFRLVIAGKSPLQICAILHDEQIEIPSYYLTKNGFVHYSVGLEAKNPYAWSERTVCRILGKEEYLGHVVNFRSSKPNFKSKRQIFHPKDEWLIFENVHEPIVTQEEWDLVQKLTKTKRRQDKHGDINPLTGLVFCAECCAKMYHSQRRDSKKSSDSYECSTYNLGQKKFDKDSCTTHFIATDSLLEILLDVIRKTAGFVQKDEGEFIRIVRENANLKQGETLKTHTRTIDKNERRIAELDKLFNSIYEDKVRGVITEERFASMSSNYEREESALKEENAALQAEIDAFSEDNQRADNFISLVRRYTRFEELTTPMINEFIDKVIVHEAEWSEATATQRRKGTRRQQVDVYLKYIGTFDVPDTRSPEEIEAQRIAEEKLEKRRTYNREYQRRKRAEPQPLEPVIKIAG